MRRQTHILNRIILAGLCALIAAEPIVAQAALIEYDTNGNMIKDESGTTYTYDAENKLIAFAKADGSAQATYTYGADGLRRSKQVKLSGGQPAPDPIVFYYDAAQDPNVVNETQGTKTASYLMVGDSRYARYLDNGPAQFYVKNHKDTTMTFGSGGANAVAHAYTPYGVERPQAQAATIDYSIASNPFLYSSQYTDSESTLQYLRARYYKPDHMRFISRDANPTPRNKYTYANGNPIMEDDPSGMMANWANYLMNGLGIAASIIGLAAGGAGAIGLAAEGLSLVSGVTGIASQAAKDAGSKDQSLDTISTVSGITSMALGGLGAASSIRGARAEARAAAEARALENKFSDHFTNELNKKNEWGGIISDWNETQSLAKANKTTHAPAYYRGKVKSGFDDKPLPEQAKELADAGYGKGYSPSPGAEKVYPDFKKIAKAFDSKNQSSLSIFEKNLYRTPRPSMVDRSAQLDETLLKDMFGRLLQPAK